VDRTARIFISYRRSDTKWAAGRLYDRLAAVLGPESVFLDVSNIEPGLDFVQAIKEVVGTCDVLLALIGESWLTTVGDRGKRNIDSIRDFVRVEIAAALERNIRVIPILVDNATLPEEEELPSDVASLARRNARHLFFESFHGDVDSFIRVLERILAGPTAQPKTVAETKQERRETGETTVVATTLPFTISLETLGGVSTPLIRQGSNLPAQARETFSTAADNQASVEIKLMAGERSKAAENVRLGTFQLGGIEPALRGMPQIQLHATVDPSLVMVVTAEDLKTHRTEVLDAVDLSGVQLPPSATVPDAAAPASTVFDFSRFDFSDFFQKEGTANPENPATRAAGSRPDPPRDIFNEFFGKKTAVDPKQAGNDTEVQLSISRSEAESGVGKAIDTPEGRKVHLKIPPNIKSGSRLRIPGRGPQHACETCHGTGSTGQGEVTCPQCRGGGKVEQMAGALKFNLTCPRCGGSGKLRGTCPTCGGDGQVRGDLYVAINVTQ